MIVTFRGSEWIKSIGLIKKLKKGDWETDVSYIQFAEVPSSFVLDVGTMEGGYMGIGANGREGLPPVRMTRSVVERLIELVQLEGAEANVIWTL